MVSLLDEKLLQLECFSYVISWYYSVLAHVVVRHEQVYGTRMYQKPVTLKPTCVHVASYDKFNVIVKAIVTPINSTP